MNQSEKSQSRSKVINKWTIGFGLIGLVIILLSVLLGIWLEDAQKDFEFLKIHAHGIKVFVEFFAHIGIALFIAAIFSFVIEFKDFTEYVERLLTHIVRDQKYLNKLSNEERINLRRDIDLVTLRAESNFGKAGDFYEFLTGIFDSIVKTCYRKEYEECCRYYIENDRLARLKTMKYCLVKGFQSNNLKITWRWGGRMDSKLNASDDIHSFIKNIELDIKIVSLNIDENYKYNIDNKKLIKTVIKTGETKAIPPKEIPIKKVEIEEFTYIEFSHEILETNNLRSDDFINISISDDIYVIPGDDPIVASRMAYPTQKPSFHYSFPESHLIHPLTPFKIHTTSKGYKINKMGKNEVHISFDDWLLPGHGVAVHWKVEQ